MPRSLPQASSSKAAGSSAPSLSQVQALEASLASNPSDLNPVGSLLDIFSTSLPASLDSAPRADQEKVAHTAAYALHRVFSSLLRQGRIHGRLRSSVGAEGEADSVKKVRAWLKKLYDEYTELLSGVLGLPGEQHRLRLDALAILTALTRTESEVRRVLAGSTNGDGAAKPPDHFPKELWAKVVKGLMMRGCRGGKTPTDVRAEFVLRYFNFCDDLRYHTLKALDALSSSHQGGNSIPPPEHISNVLTLLESLTSMPTQPSEINEFWCGRPAMPAPSESAKRKAKAANRARKRAKASASPKDEAATGIFDDSSDEGSDDGVVAAPTLSSKDLPPLLSLPAHRKAFSSAWLSFLSLPLSSDQVKRVLAVLHRLVLPHMTDPKVLMDFLVDAADQGGVVGLLALDGLFTLISKHNLDYPGFFQKLYALLDRHVLHVRYRPRFLRMLDTFLSSTHLPAVLVASFVKRLARLSLAAPPAAIVSVIPFCYNLLKRHPSCMGMLHRDGWPDNLTSDPYIEDESDPLKTNALSSSLWELASLRNHYLASVATLAKIFGEAFDKQGYDLEDFLDHSYGTLIETEVKRQIRRAPALSMEVSSNAKVGELFPTKPVGDDMAESGVERDIIGQMWVF